MTLNSNQRFSPFALWLLASLLFASFAFPQSANTQQVVTAPNGRKVILNSDGTWRYATEDETKIDLSRIETKSLIEVTSDQISFVNKPVRAEGTLKAMSSYFGLYRQSEATHYAFQLNDNGTIAYLYMPRGEKSTELRNQIFRNNGELKGEFDFLISQKAFEASRIISSIAAELLDYHPLKQARTAPASLPSTRVAIIPKDTDSKPSPTAVKVSIEAIDALTKIHDGIKLGATLPRFRDLLLDARSKVRSASALGNAEFKAELDAAIEDYIFFNQVLSDYLIRNVQVPKKSEIGVLFLSKYPIALSNGKTIHPSVIIDTIMGSALRHRNKAVEILNVLTAREN
jgi:hypothetical protein